MFINERTDIDDVRTVCADGVPVIREEKVKYVCKKFYSASAYNQGKVISLLGLDPEDFDRLVRSGRIKLVEVIE